MGLHCKDIHRVERLWPEINQRINYPVKRVLVEMEGNDEIDMTDDVVKFCVWGGGGGGGLEQLG